MSESLLHVTKRDLIIAGVGGQGIVLASKLIARAALAAGHFVRTSETIGMAQRGGTVVSHVRIGAGPDEVASPMVGARSAVAILGFEPGEAVRALPYLAPGGVVIANIRAIPPVTAALARMDYDGREMLEHLAVCDARLVAVDADAVCKAVGSAKVLNVAMLGAAAESGAVGYSVDQFEDVIRTTMPARFVDMNVAALRGGAELV